MNHVAAIDLGTTTVRAGVFDETGARVAAARRRLQTAHPFPGAVEQDPAEMVSTAVELLGVAVAEAGLAPGDLAVVGIANQRATVVAWDAETGEPLAPALGWQDTRTAPEVAELVAQGIPLTTSAGCTKLGWLVRENDAVAAAAAAGTLRLGTVDTWLTWTLSGGAVHVTDPSNAGATGLYDLRTGSWSDGALDLFAVPRAAMAEIVASDASVGVTAPELVGAAIHLTARIGDQQSAAAAHGLTPGRAKLTLGTSAMLDLATGTDVVDAPDGTYALPLWRRTVADEPADEFMLEGSVQTAGAVVEWLVAMGLLASVEELDAVAAEGSPDGVLLPALAGLGTPWQDPTARGLLAGIGLDTRPADVVRAAVEGIADRVAEVAATVGGHGELVVDGGLSRSAVVLQSIADTTGRTIRPATDPETTLQGAAALAAASADLPAGDLAPVALGEPITPSTTPAERDARHRRHAAAVTFVRTFDRPSGADWGHG